MELVPSCLQAVSKPAWRIPLLCVQWRTDGQRNCTKHVEFHSKNKFEELMHLVGFIIRNLSRCTVTWTSNSSVNWRLGVAVRKTLRKCKFYVVSSQSLGVLKVWLSNKSEWRCIFCCYTEASVYSRKLNNRIVCLV